MLAVEIVLLLELALVAVEELDKVLLLSEDVSTVVVLAALSDVDVLPLLDVVTSPVVGTMVCCSTIWT